MSKANKKLKIGIDCYKLEDLTGSQRAGVGRHLYKLLEEISKRPQLADEFKFYLYFKGHIPAYIPFFNNPIFVKKVAKLPFFLPFFRPSYNIYFHIALPIFALKDRIDATFFASFMLPALFVTKSIVVLTNDIYYEYKCGSLPKKYKIAYRLFSNWAARRATQVTTQTYASRDEISKYFNLDKDKIFVAPLGVDAQEYEPTESVRKKYYILYVGQAFPRRHLCETLLAFEKISPEFPDLKFIAIGIDKYNPPIITKLIKDINERLGDKVIWKQGVNDDELRKLYQEAKLFTYISSSEAMGLPPLEALAAGTAPVVADTSTTREIFSAEGGSASGGGNLAFYVRNPNNINNIAEVLRKALKNDAECRKITEGRGEVLEKYTWERHADLMLELFRHTAK